MKQKGQSKIMSYPNELSIVKLYDRKVVTLISSTYNGDLTDTGKKDRKPGESIQKPKVMLMYNKYMGGVDANDQLLKYSHFNRRTIKWWKKVFFRMLNICMVNAFILWKEHCKKFGTPYKKSQTDFRVSVIKKLTSKNMNDSALNNSVTEDYERLSGRHFLSKIPVPDYVKGTVIQRACRVCCPAEREFHRRRGAGKRKREGKRSTYECKTCQVTLCIDNCFEIYHSNKNFVDIYIERFLSD